jgi:ABC-2 type transport system ATP-binding protein
MENAFQISGLVKEFPEFRLGELDLDLNPGTVLGYIGPNGSGKTTTMHCMVGLIKPDRGSIKIFGKENDPNNASWKFDIGYVGDKHVFYENWSGAKNLNFLSQFYPDWSDEYANQLAKRFEVPLNKAAKDLSSGNRVKLSLIGALAHYPKLLILDEPTAGLDPVVRTEFLEVLFDVVETGERAIFYSTHILSDISRIADELAFLHNGRIKLKSAKEDLTDSWRTITFKMDKHHEIINGVVKIEIQNNEYKVISSDTSLTLEHIVELGASDINETRMSIDDIAVEILRSNKK